MRQLRDERNNDFDEYLASLNDDELALLDAKSECKDDNSEPQNSKNYLDQ